MFVPKWPTHKHLRASSSTFELMVASAHTLHGPLPGCVAFPCKDSPRPRPRDSCRCENIGRTAASAQQ
eukprot:1608597-Lingulodinium_polyedra.AAC.1